MITLGVYAVGIFVPAALYEIAVSVRQELDQQEGSRGGAHAAADPDVSG